MIYKLNVPLKEEDVRKLNVGDTVYFTGLLYTCRTLFQKQVCSEEIIPAFDFENINLMAHVGPVMKLTDKWQPVSFDPTSSIRFEKFGPQIISKLKTRAIIGKTTMGAQTLKTMQEFGCVHLTKVGIYGNVLAKKIKEVVTVYNLEEFGKTEATWIMEVNDFGPFIVDMDTKGRNYFENLRGNTAKNLTEQYQKLILDELFEYTEI